MTNNDLLKEHRANHIFNQLKCLSCNGESIKESQSDFSTILRDDIRKDIENGLEDEEIINKIVTNYGDEILMTSFGQETILLWFLPVIVMVLFLSRWLKGLKIN